MQRLRQYLLLIGGLLLIQGITVILFIGLPYSLPSPWNRAIRPDLFHSCIHVGWAILLWLGLKQKKVIILGWSFGLFFGLFGLLGVAIHHPFGLLLDRGENLFHLLIGAIGIILTGATQKRQSKQA